MEENVEKCIGFSIDKSLKKKGKRSFSLKSVF